MAYAGHSSPGNQRPRYYERSRLSDRSLVPISEQYAGPRILDYVGGVDIDSTYGAMLCCLRSRQNKDASMPYFKITSDALPDCS